MAELNASETELIDTFRKFLEDNYGTVLKAWRYVLEANGHGEVLYSEFIEAVAAMPKWHGDVTALWTAFMRRARAHTDDFQDQVLRLRELSPEDHQCLEGFKQWADAAFGGALEVYKASTDGRPNAIMSSLEFEEVCRSNGFTGDWRKLFFGCLCPDSHEKGCSMRDIAYLETRAIKRKEAMDPGFVIQQNAAKAAAKRIKHRRQRLKRAQSQAMEELLRKVRKAYGGSLIRGWRRILDANGNLAISKTELLKGCRKIAFSGDVVALWKGMDVDDDGIIQLEEVDVELALVLASFKKWATEENGSCLATLYELGALMKIQTYKWDFKSFYMALQEAGFSGCLTSLQTSEKQAATMLYEAFDVENRGFFTVQDVAFLDKWGPTSWLVADPSEEDKESFIRALRSRFPSLVVAWRKLLDRDNSNNVSYKEFLEACRVLKIANPAGAWRALDDDSSGFISLEEIDREAADMLLHLKIWAEETFGTIPNMFQVFDKHKVGKVSFPVFKRALRNFGFQGNAFMLFQSLIPQASKKGSKKKSHHELTLHDLLYLSSWETDEDEKKNEDTIKSRRRTLTDTPTNAKAANAAPPQPEARSPRPEPPMAEPGTPAPVAPSETRKIAEAKLCGFARQTRQPDEFRVFLQADQRQKLLTAYGPTRAPNMKRLGTADQKLLQLIPTHGGASPMSLLERRKLPRIHAGSKSLGRMQQLPSAPLPAGHGDQALLYGEGIDSILAKKAPRLQQVVSLPSL